MYCRPKGGHIHDSELEQSAIEMWGIEPADIQPQILPSLATIIFGCQLCISMLRSPSMHGTAGHAAGSRPAVLQPKV